MKKILHLVAIVLFLLLSISACSSSNKTFTQSPPNEEITQIIPGESESYPVSTAVRDGQSTSYPATGDDTSDDNGESTQATSEPLVIPDANPDSAVVHGQIYSYTTNEVLPNVMVYLAEKVLLEPGPNYTISFQEKSSPHAQTNERGEFLIVDVAPDEYIPIMVTPFGIFPLANEETDEIELVVETNQTYDLDTTFVNWP
ncbi:MAG: hypothetical protein P1P73_07305 [Brevefilum sp.]|nr:hypothetical protein [Brevefilum sp.]